MKTIYKYQLDVTDVQTLHIPKNSKILTIQTQREIPCIWALVDTNEKNEDRKIKIYGTGHECGTGREEYIGSFQLENGALVFHVFESF